jgi:hypothetical protein
MLRRDHLDSLAEYRLDADDGAVVMVSAGCDDGAGYVALLDLSKIGEQVRPGLPAQSRREHSIPQVCRRGIAAGDSGFAHSKDEYQELT